MSYIPPHLRSQATASGSIAEETPPPSAPAPANPSYSDRGASRGDRSQRGGFRGTPHRGPRGGSHGGFGYSKRFERHNSDDADTVHSNDITRHFWPQADDSAVSEIKSTTFHDSAVYPEQLHYMLLFVGTNPRWNSDGIVFAKSNLGLLPGFVEQKLKNGPWDLPATTREARLEEDSLRDTGPTAVVVEDAVASARVTTVTEEVSVSSREPPSEEAGNQDKTQGAPTSPLSVRTIPASEFYSESHTPSLPSIPPIDYTPDGHEPIAVFQQVKSSSKDTFIFSGWYQVARVNIIAPRSAELVRMQQQKWERRDKWGNIVTTQSRDASKWKSSMHHEWAVVKFEQLGAGVTPPKPVIEKTEETVRKSSVDAEKSVAEMLQELRLKDGNVNISGSDNHDEKVPLQVVEQSDQRGSLPS